MTPTELAEFNEIREALDIVNASKYIEAQINGMGEYHFIKNVVKLLAS